MLNINALLCITCVMVFTHVNYTFPLHRGTATIASTFGNESIEGKNTEHHQYHILDRTKKMSTYIENAFKVIKNNVQDPVKCKKDSNISGDLNHYDQMVIMKKNPFLDFKELVSKIYASSALKNTRHAVRVVDPGLHLKDPSICEDGPNVEVINRGLTGFAIPSKLIKSAIVPPTDTKLKLNLQNDLSNTHATTITINNNTDNSLLTDLESDIQRFTDKKY